MYLYWFTNYAWFDKVVSVSSVKCKSWDLLKLGDQFFLALWEEIAFSELYLTSTSGNFEVILSWFLGKKTLELLHWMVAEYYTSYKNVMKYFLPEEIEHFLGREVPGKVSKKSAKTQTLTVFPDLWTLMNTLDGKDFSDENNVVLHSWITQVQKDKAWWKIKKGLVSNVFCTYWEVFQDFFALQKIVFLDPHKWYYANQQDPRFKLGDVLDKMADLWWISVIREGI